MSIIENAVNWCLAIANDNSHGYDQINRNGPDYDCSSLVITAYKKAGVNLTCTYTGNMRADMLKKGFKEVPISERKRGDILLAHNPKTEKGHTAIVVDKNTICHASINEKGTATGGKVGDQTGNEICVRSYYNKPWDWCLRYSGTNESASKTSSNASSETLVTIKLPTLRKGSRGYNVRVLQVMLNYNGANISVDGDFGPKTLKAVETYQKNSGIGVDGIAGIKTWSKLLNAQ